MKTTITVEARDWVGDVVGRRSRSGSADTIRRAITEMAGSRRTQDWISGSRAECVVIRQDGQHVVTVWPDSVDWKI